MLMDDKLVQQTLDEHFSKKVEDVEVSQVTPRRHRTHAHTRLTLPQTPLFPPNTQPGNVRWISITGLDPSVFVRLAHHYKLSLFMVRQ